MLDKINPQLDIVSQSDFEAAVNTLQSHVNNKRNFNGNQYILSQGATFEVNWHSQNRRREYFSGCTFQKSTLDEAGFTGGVFSETAFSDCTFNFTNLNNCSFKSCTWKGTAPDFQMGTNFSQSFMLNCELENMRFQGGNFSNTRIVRSTFSHCRFRATLFEGTVFSKTIFDHVRFGKMNLEFVHFNDIHCNSVTLPFPSVPYIFRGVDYLINTDDNVRVTSAISSRHKISKEEYIDLLPTLSVYYAGTHNYFPLANIQLAIGERQKARDYVLSGISQALALRNFNSLVHLCELISDGQLLSGSECIDLFADIWLSAKNQKISQSDFYLLNAAMQRIEKTLLNFNQKSVFFLLTTNIDSTESVKLTKLLEELELFSSLVSDGAKNKIELRHCSPYEVFLTIWTEAESLPLYIALFYCAFTGVEKLYNRILSDISNTQKLVLSSQEKRKNELEIESLQLANEAQKMNNQLKKEELRQLRQKAAQTYRNITEAGIIICSASHNITEDATAYVPKELRTERINRHSK